MGLILLGLHMPASIMCLLFDTWPRVNMFSTDQVLPLCWLSKPNPVLSESGVMQMVTVHTILTLPNHTGGILKICGSHICPEVPYKSLLLSVSDTVAEVIRQGLDKYGLDDADADAYCLVMRTRRSAVRSSWQPTASSNRSKQEGAEVEEILDDSDCPLKRLYAAFGKPGVTITFEVGH